MNWVATGRMETTPEVEILESVFAVSSSSALALMVTAAEELRTSEEADAPIALALAERQFACPLVVMLISPARDKKFPPNM